MDTHQINKWQQIIGEEHGKLRVMESQNVRLQKEIAQLKTQLRRAAEYAHFLDKKNDQQAKNASLLQHTISMLKKAKAVIAHRKREVVALLSENKQLKAELIEYKLRVERHEDQMQSMQQKINNLQNKLYAKDRGNTEILLIGKSTQADASYQVINTEKGSKPLLFQQSCD